MIQPHISPCLGCIRVRDPENCENKNCVLWKSWFLSRWSMIHGYLRRQMDKPVQTVGVPLGGERYATPDQVRRYLKNDPCSGCSCGSDLCITPCRARQNWAKANGEVKQ